MSYVFRGNWTKYVLSQNFAPLVLICSHNVDGQLFHVEHNPLLKNAD